MDHGSWRHFFLKKFVSQAAADGHVSKRLRSWCAGQAETQFQRRKVKQGQKRGSAIPLGNKAMKTYTEKPSPMRHVCSECQDSWPSCGWRGDGRGMSQREARRGTSDAASLTPPLALMNAFLLLNERKRTVRWLKTNKASVWEILSNSET